MEGKSSYLLNDHEGTFLLDVSSLFLIPRLQNQSIFRIRRLSLLKSDLWPFTALRELQAPPANMLSRRQYKTQWASVLILKTSWFKLKEPFLGGEEFLLRKPSLSNIKMLPFGFIILRLHWHICKFRR